MKVQGEFKMQAHRISSVVVDIAAFKVGHSVGFDMDATALRAARARSSYIHRGHGRLHAWVRFGDKTHGALPRYTANSEHTIGAMDESSG